MWLNGNQVRDTESAVYRSDFSKWYLPATTKTLCGATGWVWYVHNSNY